ncbi:RimJ/RimL family protein N-acetyltransferase [Mycobacterium frederiksbergense]|uniref:RimJ/RimL family protein N-acetyltransferase n=1 Tax=Mycolicibacterium frederiksbergense TaxID=117567 RepID=A0ABT6LAZ7_9MYCO|nr:GNAT family N-acetyltransferase [Mycolicibacterium frederiksbergense]MDH6199160.1 RimJ/RimL family protein N-acetyltransferase [Mycolicibacterium frederiksbergense]
MCDSRFERRYSVADCYVATGRLLVVEPVVLQTARLVLRCVTSTDEDALVNACNDPLLARYVPVPSPYLHEDARKYVAEVAEGWAADTEFAFGFYVASTGQLAGTCGLKRRAQGTVEVGYWTASQHRGHGFATEAVRRLCQWAFDELDFGQIELWAEVENDSSRAVATRVGFKMDRLLRHQPHQANPAGPSRDWWIGSLESRPI